MTRTMFKMVWLIAFASLSAGVFASCVWRTEHKVETVSKIDAHIVIDIRQIKAEANQVENYVRGAETGESPAGQVPAGDAPAPTSLRMDLERPTQLALAESQAVARQLAHRHVWWAVFSLGAPAMAAPEKAAPRQGGESSLTDEAAKKAADSRRARAKAVDEGLAKGFVGENDRGYLDVLVDPKEKELAKTYTELVRDENRDRKVIYQAIARDKKVADLALVEVIFAETNREKLKKGQMFQAPRDKEFFAAFKESKLGKQFPDAKPGQWLKK